MRADVGNPGTVIAGRLDPDPTLLTTQQLLREISNLQSRLEDRIESVEKSIIVSHDDLVRVPTAVDKAIETLRQLTWGRFDTHDVRFDGISTQFKERDIRVEQTAKASKEALDAALQAAKEAVGVQQQSNSLAINKSETATKEQINQLGTLIQQNTKATDEKIADIKDRLTRFEGMGTGRGDMWGWFVGALGVLSLLVSITFYIVRMAK